MKELYETFLQTHFGNNFAPKKPFQCYSNTDKLAVIIDPRYDDIMKCVIRNFMFFLNPLGWNLLIVSAATHKPQIKADFPFAYFMSIDDKLLLKDTEGNSFASMSIDSYNKMLMSLDFWKNLPSEHLLIFQKDCIMFHMFDESKYFLYDYAGANYATPTDIAFNTGGINGGCSLRSKQAMIDCLQFVSWDLIKQVRGNWLRLYPINIPGFKIEPEVGKRNEDVFFSHACEILHKCTPPMIERGLFSVEAEYNKDTCFYHGWNKNYHKKEETETLLAGLLALLNSSA